jgi:hypothetical protein
MLRAKSNTDFTVIKQNLIARKHTFFIEQKANNYSIIFNNKKQSTFYSKASQVDGYFKDKTKIGVIASIHKEIERYIKSQNLYIEKIKPVHAPMLKEFKSFRELPNDTNLVIVDIKHAYWRIAYLLGYINKKLYKRYADNEDYKLARNIGLSTLVSKKFREMYVNGIQVYKLQCINPQNNVIYENIRHVTYNFIGELHEELGVYSFGYRTDGLLALNTPEVIEHCKDYFKKNKLLFEATEYIKVNDKEIKSVLTGKVKKYF